jgi:hypothetical protein
MSGTTACRRRSFDSPIKPSPLSNAPSIDASPRSGGARIYGAMISTPGKYVR